MQDVSHQRRPGRPPSDRGRSRYERRAAGLTLAEIAEQDGVTDGAIWQSIRDYARRSGLPMPEPRLVSMAAAAREIGVSEDVLNRIGAKGLLPCAARHRYSIDDVRAALSELGWSPNGKVPAIYNPNGKRGAAVLARRAEREAGEFMCIGCREVKSAARFPPSSMRRGIWQCRDCRKEMKRDHRRRKAEADGREFVPRADRAAYDEHLRLARAKRKLGRRVAWAICTAFRRLVRLTREEAIARSVARQRERRRTDAAYWAACKAKKLRRTRAQRATKVERVSIHRVAERDGWKCAICGGEVTCTTWSMDHVIPLSKGGPHVYDNVVLAHRSCNSKRGAGRFPVQAPPRAA